MSSHQEQIEAANQIKEDAEERTRGENDGAYEPEEPHAALGMAATASGLSSANEFCCECMGLPKRPKVDEEGNPVLDENGRQIETCDIPPGSIELLNGLLDAMLAPAINAAIEISSNLPGAPEAAVNLGLDAPPIQIANAAPGLPGIPNLPAIASPPLPNPDLPPLPPIPDPPPNPAVSLTAELILPVLLVPFDLVLGALGSIDPTAPESPFPIPVPDPIPGPPNFGKMGGCLAKSLGAFAGTDLSTGDGPVLKLVSEEEEEAGEEASDDDNVEE